MVMKIQSSLLKFIRAVLAVTLFFGLCWHAISAQTTETNGQLGLATIKFVRTPDGPALSIERFKVLDTTKKIPVASVHDAVYAILLTDMAGVALDTLFIRDPLNPVYEHPDDNGGIGLTQVPVDEDEILVRFSYTPEMKLLQIARVSENRKYEPLHTLTLPIAEK